MTWERILEGRKYITLDRLRAWKAIDKLIDKQPATRADYERTAKLAATARAEALWATFNASEKRGVQFGVFPKAKMEPVIAEGHDGRELTLALMAFASRDALKG